MRQFLLCGVLAACISNSASAALGDAPSDFGNQRTGVVAKVLAARSVNYRVNASTLEGGTIVREYVANNGHVFAVSWVGPLQPNLATLLGTYFEVMQTEVAKTPRAGHSQVQIVRPDVTIVAGGHMRAFKGRAWLTSSFPVGFTLADIL